MGDAALLPPDDIGGCCALTAVNSRDEAVVAQPAPLGRRVCDRQWHTTIRENPELEAQSSVSR